MHLKFVALSSALLAAGCVSAVPEADTAGKEGCAAKTAQAEADAVQVDEDRDPTMFAARAGGTSLVLVKVGQAQRIHHDDIRREEPQRLTIPFDMPAARCTKCRADLLIGTRFCVECGTPNQLSLSA